MIRIRMSVARHPAAKADHGSDSRRAHDVWRRYCRPKPIPVRVRSRWPLSIDDSAEILTAAAKTLDSSRTRLTKARLQDPLPAGPFDLVLSMLAVHHLDGPGKADLFRRVARTMSRRGRFVLADLIIPADPQDVITPIDGVIDTPSTLPEQLTWMRDAGLSPEVLWKHRDLVVIVAHQQP